MVQKLLAEGKRTGLVSVAMTTYNGSRYLREQLGSIFAQSYKEIEVVVSDDCSIDSTVNILEEYKVKCRLRYVINESNIGFLNNFANVLSLCSGKYIALADQDDIWYTTKIQKLVENIGGHSLIYSDAALIDDSGNVMCGSKKKEFSLNDHSGITFSELVFKNYIAGCTSMISRDVLDIALPFPEGALFHDWWFAMVASKMNGIKFLDEPLMGYRQHRDNYYGFRGGGIFRKVLTSVLRTDEKVNRHKERKARLEHMLAHPILSHEDREIVKEAIKYYASYLDYKLPFRYWLLCAKYFNQRTVRKWLFQ